MGDGRWEMGDGRWEMAEFAKDADTAATSFDDSQALSAAFADTRTTGAPGIESE